MLAEKSSGPARFGLVRTRASVILQVGSNIFRYPSSKFEHDVGAWNSLILAGLAVSGRTDVKFNYPESYEYRWIFDPIVEKYPFLRSESPADYYSLLLLTEDVSYIGGRPGPATIRTIRRITSLVRRGWELWEESPKQLESPLLTARLLLTSGYFDCRDDCSEYHVDRFRLRRKFTLLSAIFTEELYEQYAREERPVPGVEAFVNDSPSMKTRLHIVFLENIVLGILDGTLGGFLDRTLRRMGSPMNVRLWSAWTDRHSVHLEISSSRLGGERVLYKYSIAEFTNLMNNVADTLLGSGPEEAVNLLLSRGATINMITCDRYDIVLSGDHATLVSQKDGRVIGKYLSLHALRDALFQVSGNHTRILWKLCESMGTIRKHAPSIAGRSRCPVLDEIILERELYYIGRIGRRYAYISMNSLPVAGEPRVGIGDTIYDALPRSWNVILETLSAIGMQETREALEEADTILKTALHGQNYTDILVLSGPCPVVERLHADRPVDMRDAVIVLCPEKDRLPSIFLREEDENPLIEHGALRVLRYEYERILVGLLERHGWKSTGTITGRTGEKYRAYGKNGVYVIYAPEDFYIAHAPGE